MKKSFKIPKENLKKIYAGTNIKPAPSTLMDICKFQAANSDIATGRVPTAPLCSGTITRDDRISNPQMGKGG